MKGKNKKNTISRPFVAESITLVNTFTSCRKFLHQFAIVAFTKRMMSLLLACSTPSYLFLDCFR